MAGKPQAGGSLPAFSEPAATRALGGVAAAWKPWTAGVAFVAAVALALPGRAIVSGDGAGALAGIAIAFAVLSAAPVGLALLLAHLHAPPAAADFGLRRPPLARAIALSIVVWIGLAALMVLWVGALGIDDEEPQALTERLGTDGALKALILIAVLTILGPLGEEFLFRGYIFRALLNWRGLWPAAIASGVLFAATHIGWLPSAVLVAVALFGIGLCLLYHWTGSLYPCIAVHAVNNSIPLGAALNWTWQTPLLIVGSTLATLTIARLLARQLDRHALTSAPNMS